jgi:peptide/nickel transport system substrate-binding protein
VVSTKTTTKRSLLSLLVALTLLLASCGGDGDAEGTEGTDEGSEPAEEVGEPQPGGELTALLGAGFAGAWPTGLDPATNNTGGANLPQNFAIYGGLFHLYQEPGSDEAEIIGHQVEEWEFTEEGRVFTFTLRDGIEFSDGTPLDADAVVWNFERALAADCSCNPLWTPGVVIPEEDAILALDDRTVQVTFIDPNPAVISGFPATNLNWIASPTAVEEMGEEAFAQNPVGAGPFTVVSNTPDTELVLERNENYFREGLPYLDQLTFQTVADDQTGWNAVQAGQGHTTGLGTISLIDQAETNPDVTTTIQPATSPYIVQLNTAKPPFDDQRVREAFYYATDTESINEGLFGGRFPASQSFTAEGGLFHRQEIPGYRTYDPERAQEIVEEVGGIELSLGTLQTPLADQVNIALQTQWQEAGMDVSIESWELAALVEEFETGNWDAMLQTVGAWDPAAGVGVDFRFHSMAPFTGVWDEELDAMLDEAAATIDPDERDGLYFEAAQHISDNAYAPILFAIGGANVAVNGVHGPGLTTEIPSIAVATAIFWDEVWMEESVR